MEGIITDRDILRATADENVSLKQVRVSEVMTVEVITGGPDDSVASVMGLLTEKRIRHLPIVHGGKLIGMISIGDVVKAQFNELAMENHYLKEYLQG